ncbi:MAG: hypothetical protein JOY58_04000 [Solirubrobacterales bacterium]|nr:hypothetical protein [Solirubrobacterales bacterium]
MSELEPLPPAGAEPSGCAGDAAAAVLPAGLVGAVVELAAPLLVTPVADPALAEAWLVGPVAPVEDE